MPYFNPDELGIDNGNYFGMPFNPKTSDVVLISVPWDATSPGDESASFAPDAIIEASVRIEQYDPMATGAWRKGIATVPIDYSIQERSSRLKADAKRVIKLIESGGSLRLDDMILQHSLTRVNKGSAEINDQIFQQAAEFIAQGKTVGVIGGDHSAPFGAVKAAAEASGGMGVLQFDAHCDLLEQHQGFDFSHASAMYNILKRIPQVTRIVQVGVRDAKDSEMIFAESSDRITAFPDFKLSSNEFNGATWNEQCEKIVSLLPSNVYITFDIDGLVPSNCASAGFAVPGGLSYNKALYLMKKVVDTGRKIVGFDLCEVVPDPSNKLNAHVAARLLYEICGQAIRSKYHKV